MMRRTLRLIASTNRYTDGSGRQLDSDMAPTDLYNYTISNRAYPLQGEVWQPVVLNEKPSTPHKGSVVVSGGGVVGLTLAAQFGLRGWHTTVLVQSPSLRVAREDADGRSQMGGSQGSSSVRRPHAEYFSRPLAEPFVELEYALLTRRALDALETAGVRLQDIRPFGVPVCGVLDHPGAYNNWLTHGLVENHRFSVKMLSVDIFKLRRFMEAHVEHLPTGNVNVFYEHGVEAVNPLRQQIVVKPLNPIHNEAPQHNNNTAALEAVSLEEAVSTRKRLDTSLSVSPLKWDKCFAKDAVDYDLLVCAEGVNSHLRDLLDVEGFAADADMSTKWFLLRTSALSHGHIHRWLHRRRCATKSHGHLRSSIQVPMVLAFPRVEADDMFSLMVYMPRGELSTLSDADVLSQLLPDVASGDTSAELVSFNNSPTPAPTIFCENLYNTVGLPSAVVVGDAAHSCHNFWMQNLSIGLEDGVNLIQQVDAYSRHFYDAVKQYSNERGTCGDSLRELTERCLYYEQRKHRNPLLRLRNAYRQTMNHYLPRGVNAFYNTTASYLYSKALEDMINGRGYTSYEFAEKQQAKHSKFYYFSRLYS